MSEFVFKCGCKIRGHAPIVQEVELCNRHKRDTPKPLFFGVKDLKDKNGIAQTSANVLIFHNYLLSKKAIEKIAKIIVKELPETEHYIDLNDEWIYRGDEVYEHRETHEIRRYPP